MMPDQDCAGLSGNNDNMSESFPGIPLKALVILKDSKHVRMACALGIGRAGALMLQAFNR